MNPVKSSFDELIEAIKYEENTLREQAYNIHTSFRSHSICLFGSFEWGKYKIVNYCLGNDIFVPESYHKDERLWEYYFLIKRAIGSHHTIEYQNEKVEFGNIADLSAGLRDLTWRDNKMSKSVCLSLAIENSSILGDGTEIIVFPHQSRYQTDSLESLSRYASCICVYVIRGSVTSQDRNHYQYFLRVMENVKWFILVYDYDGIDSTSEGDRTMDRVLIAWHLGDLDERKVNVHRIFFVSSQEPSLGHPIKLVSSNTELSWKDVRNLPSPCRNLGNPKHGRFGSSLDSDSRTTPDTDSTTSSDMVERSEYLELFIQHNPSNYPIHESEYISGGYCRTVYSMETESSACRETTQSLGLSFIDESPQRTLTKHMFQYPTEMSDQMNQDELQTRLEKIYKKLKTDLTKCKESGNEKLMKESPLINVTDFLDLYDGSLRIKIKKLHVLHNVPNNESVSLNCLCVSINIVNLLMDQIDVIGSSRIIAGFFSYLGDFQCQDKSNRIARRMQEMILYCLCNYYDNECERELKLIDCDVQWRDALERCFFQNQDSNKIKLSAAIVLSFNYHQMDPLKYQQTLDYLTNIKSTYIHKETDKYLGIRGDLIVAAIRKFPLRVSQTISKIFHFAEFFCRFLNLLDF